MARGMHQDPEGCWCSRSGEGAWKGPDLGSGLCCSQGAAALAAGKIIRLEIVPQGSEGSRGFLPSAAHELGKLNCKWQKPAGSSGARNWTASSSLEHYLEMRKEMERAKGSKVKKKREDKKKRKAEFTFKAVHCWIQPLFVKPSEELQMPKVEIDFPSSAWCWLVFYTQSTRLV